jgi:hypothetical protein
VLGDSVVNGGALTDQKDLASEILGRQLDAHAWVGNISAGSWGPANLLAYVSKYGWFEADAAIIVVNTDDLEDLPEFRSYYGVDFPEKTPASALVEAITRYLPRYLPAIAPYLQTEPASPTVTYSADERRQLGEAALQKLIDTARANVRNVILITHPSLSELGSSSGSTQSRARASLKQVIERSGVAYFDPAGDARWNGTLYRDDIHINALGQAIYARIFECLLWAVRRGDDTAVCRIAEPSS